MAFDDDNDPILDACLEEVLAGRRPPDLAARIMQSVEAGGIAHAGKVSLPTALDNLEVPEPPPVLTRIAVSSLHDSQPMVALRGPAAHHKSRREKSSWVLLVALTAAIVGLGITIGMLMLLNPDRQQVAQQPPDGPATTNSIAVNKPARTESRPQQIPTKHEPTGALVVQPLRPEPASNPSPTHSVVSPSVPAPEPKGPADAVVVNRPERRYARPSPDSQIVSFVNSDLARAWTEAGVKPSPAATDAQWCERVFASVLGRSPTAAELKALADDKSANRREKLVERLLTQAEFIEDYADHWSGIWTNVFIGKTGGQAGSLASREDLQKYFHGALIANKRYNEIARELLTATGSARPGPDDHNPAVNFLLDRLNADADATFPTARVARVLLGHQLQCAQCHEHPTHGWSQEQFWAFNAFFRQMRLERVDGGARLTNADFRARSGQSGGEVFYETPDGLMRTALPKFIDGTAIPPSGELATVDRRRELATLIVQSDEFAKAAVNRFWAQIFDYGFTRPIDDLGPKATPTTPLTLDRLATEFAAHDYDLKQLIRWSVLSDPFGRSSKLADLVSKDMPEEGEPALFSRDYARPSQAAAVFDSLVQSVRIRGSSGSKTEVEKARIDWLTQANRTAAKKGGKIAVPSVGPSVLMKTDSTPRSAAGDPTGLVKKLIGSSMPFDKKVEHVFLLAVARQPFPRERKAATDLLAATKDNQASALEDIWWALANSNECVIDR